MPNPQQPGVRRSETVPAITPDATESELEAHDRPDERDDPGPVPPEQQRGHDHDDPDRPDDPTGDERLPGN